MSPRLQTENVSRWLKNGQLNATVSLMLLCSQISSYWFAQEWYTYLNILPREQVDFLYGRFRAHEHFTKVREILDLLHTEENETRKGKTTDLETVPNIRVLHPHLSNGTIADESAENVLIPITSTPLGDHNLFMIFPSWIGESGGGVMIYPNGSN